MSTNLLSVTHLTKDNHCKVTFDSDSFVIQDKATNYVLHKGTNINGLYHFPWIQSAGPQAFVSSTTSGISSVPAHI